MLKLPFNVTHASKETTLNLIRMGIIEVREDGLHVKENIPATTANLSRDK